jgi:2-polyprenyl-3-methyl-5-hydroxy-6-metoxy-1,4-benzoquinol methylase
MQAGTRRAKGERKKTRRIKAYYNDRKEFHYYKKVKEILEGLHLSSIIDIGCRKSPMMKGLGKNVYKAMLDIQEIPPIDGINMIRADFYTWKPDRKYDVVLCLQVLEHLDKPKKFAQKLLQVGKTVIISVPYKWKKGSCKYHTQDPVDESKIKGWVGRDPDEQYIITDNNRKRIICVYH